ncbi:MAG: hypothetical protein NC131_19785 [Roseburia sp.]|nr:hypothetical protein [Roseburia sp.]
MELFSIKNERKIDRFDKYMKLSGLNDNKVTDQLKLSVGTIGKSRKDGRDLSQKVIDKILNFYTDLSRTWLLAGEGDMINQEPPRGVRNVTNGGMATLGNQSPILKDVKIEIENELEKKTTESKNVDGLQKEIKRLRELLVKAEREISRLDGRVEEQDKFIDKLLERR